ncbi:uncharacterized protein LOC111103940 [Crassostrea virginica]
MPRSKKRGGAKTAAAKASAAVEEVPSDAPEAPQGRRTRGATSQSPAPQEPSPSPAARSRSRGKASETPKETRGRSHGRGDNTEGAGRVTRAVVQEVEVEESPKRGRSTSRRGKQASQPASSKSSPKSPAKAKKTPTKGSRSRSARGKKQVVEDVDMEDEEEEEAEEEEIEEEPVKSTPKGRGRGAKKGTPKKSPAAKSSPAPKQTPAKGASRSRSKAKQENAEEQQSPLPNAQIVLTKIDSPKKDASPTKSPSPKAAKKTPSPRKAASAKKTPPSARRGGRSRRGAPDVEEEAPEKEEEGGQVSDDLEKNKEETEEKPQTEAEEKAEDVQPEKTAETMEEEGEKLVQDNEEVSDMAKEEDKIDAAQENSIAENGKDEEAPSQKRKFEEIQDGEIEEEDEDLSAKKAKIIEETVPQANGNPEENSMESEPSVERNEKVEESEADVEKDYVMVNMNEVPAADSSEIMKSIPRTSEDQEEKKKVAERIVETVVTVNQVIEQPAGVIEDREDVEMLEEAEEILEEVAEILEEVVEAPIQKEVFQPLGNQEVVQEVGNIPEPQQDVVQKENYVSVPQQEELVQEASSGPPKQAEETVQSLNLDMNKQSPVSNTGTQNWVLNRQFVKNPAFRDDVADLAKQFSVVSYNVLAQCHLDRGDYSFTPPQYLAADYRHRKIVEELRYLKGDIVCLQEMDPGFYNGALGAAMKEMGYEGLMKKRTDDYSNEGEATFFRTSRFTVVDRQSYSMAELANKEIDDGLDPMQKEAIRSYLNRPDVMVLVKLRCNVTGQILTVGNIHVHWGKMKVPDVQCIQIASAIKEVVSKAGSDLTPHILCGDFNSEVTSPGYQLCKEGYLSDSCIQQLQSLENLQFPDGTKSSLINTVWRAFQHTSSSMKSAYNMAQGREPKITSYHNSMKAAVDYVFFSSNCLDNVGVLGLPSDEAIAQTGGIPNEVFPSDHVSIKAVFSFR